MPGHLIIIPVDGRMQVQQIERSAFGDLRHCVSVQFGKANAFRDRVEFNTARKNGASFKLSSIEPRRGYKLATFEI